MATLGAQLTSAANAGAALNNPQDYVSEIGRAQQAYKQYGDAGRSDLQQNASSYADTIRAAAKAKGIDLSPYGTANSYGTDYTKNYSGANPLAYDPTKSGQVAYAPKSPVVDAAKTGGTFNALGKAGDGSGDTNNGGGNGGGTGGGGNSGGGAPNNDSLIKSIYDSMYTSQSQKAKALRDQQLAGLAGQDTLAQNNAQTSLNANDVSGSRLANQLREHMANLGLLQGGDYISQQVGQNTAQGQNANQINMDLANKLQGLAAQKDAINNNASASDLALLQQIQAEQGKAQLGDAYKQQDQSNWQKTFDQTGQNNKFTQNLQTTQENRAAQGQNFNQNLETQKFDQTVTQDQIKNGQWTQQFTNQMKQWADTQNLDWAKFSQDTKNALAQIAVSQQNANTNQTQANNSYQLGLGNQAIAKQNADTQLANSKRADTQQGLDNLYKTWTDSGKAPAGIPGVQEGTSLYDRTAAQRQIADAFKVMNETGVAPTGLESVGIMPGTPKQSVSANNKANLSGKLGDYASQLDSLKLGPAELKKALQGEKDKIIKETSIGDYNKLYNTYFDLFGNPK